MQMTLKQARLFADLTQKELAETLGVHAHTYMKWERNPEDMSIGTGKQIAKILKMDFEEIFFEDESILNRQDEIEVAK